MKIGERILELRKSMNITQEELAEKVGVTRQTISNWELGESSPDLKQAKELSKIFKISLDELVDNNIKDVVVTKVSNTERLAGIIIKILKVMAILLLLFMIGIICVTVLFNYFEAKPVGSSIGISCQRDGNVYYYEVSTDINNQHMITNFYTDDDETAKKMNIDINNYHSPESLLNDIKDYVTSNGGNCD